MHPTPGLAVLSLLLVGVIGFAAHRASLCTVKAVAEVMTTGQGWMLASFAKAAAWTAVIAGLLAYFSPVTAAPVLERVPYLFALVGGFLFGIGAAINGGCSLSTLQRLADGDLSMLGTLAAFVIGVLAWSQLNITLGSSTLQALPSIWQSRQPWVLALLIVLSLWAIREAIQLTRNNGPARNLRHRLLAPSYRLSTTAALLGIAGGILYNLQGAWTYTNFLRADVASWFGAGPAPTLLHGLLLFALIGGMLASSLQRRSFALNTHWRQLLPRRLAGGFLMGIGGALIPGGNDTLILAAIPTLSLLALGNYLALLAGVASVLLVMRAMSGNLPPVECSNDQCL